MQLRSPRQKVTFMLLSNMSFDILKILTKIETTPIAGRPSSRFSVDIFK